MIVIDASALIEVLLQTSAADVIEHRLFEPREMLCAPHLIDVEVAQVIQRFAARGHIDPEKGRAALADLSDFPIHRYQHDLLLPRIWELRHNLTAYDAAYVALAESLGGPLVTRDRRLATAAGHHARIEVV